MTTGAYAIREYAQPTVGGGVPGVCGGQRLSWMNTRVPEVTFAAIFVSEVSESYYSPTATPEHNARLLVNWQDDIAEYEALVQQVEDRERWPWLLLELIHVYESRPGDPDAFVVAPIVPFGAGLIPDIPLPTHINSPNLIMLTRKRGIETFRLALEQRGSPTEPQLMYISTTGSMDRFALHPGLDDWEIETREELEVRERTDGRWILWLSEILEEFLGL